MTRAVTDAGAIVVFAAGNSGGEEVEMSLNPFSNAPLVISVAAGTIDHHRGDFSSNGLAHDNSAPASVGAGGHNVFTGDRIGVYHPDATAPGVDISSTCDTAGTVSDLARRVRTPSPAAPAWPRRTSPVRWRYCCRPTRT